MFDEQFLEQFDDQFIDFLIVNANFIEETVINFLKTYGLDLNRFLFL